MLFFAFGFLGWRFLCAAPEAVGSVVARLKSENNKRARLGVAVPRCAVLGWAGRFPAPLSLLGAGIPGIWPRAFGPVELDWSSTMFPKRWFQMDPKLLRGSCCDYYGVELARLGERPRPMIRCDCPVISTRRAYIRRGERARALFRLQPVPEMLASDYTGDTVC